MKAHHYIAIASNISSVILQERIDDYFYNIDPDVPPGTKVDIYLLSNDTYAIVCNKYIKDEIWLYLTMSVFGAPHIPENASLISYFTIRPSQVFNAALIGQQVMILMPGPSLEVIALAVTETGYNLNISTELQVTPSQETIPFVQPDLRFLATEPLYSKLVSNFNEAIPIEANDADAELIPDYASPKMEPDHTIRIFVAITTGILIFVNLFLKDPDDAFVFNNLYYVCLAVWFALDIHIIQRQKHFIEAIVFGIFLASVGYFFIATNYFGDLNTEIMSWAAAPLIVIVVHKLMQLIYTKLFNIKLPKLKTDPDISALFYFGVILLISILICIPIASNF